MGVATGIPLPFEPIAAVAGPALRVTLDGDTIAWRPAADPGAEAQRKLLGDIRFVSLGVLPRPGTAMRQGICTIGFADQTEFVALSIDEQAAAGAESARAYAGFVDALHSRLAARGGIRFLIATLDGDGATGRALLLAGLLALAFLVLGWLADGPWWVSMIVLLAAALAARVLLRRRPQAEYDPRAIPPNLRPG